MVKLTAWVVALAGAAAWLWSGVGWSTTPESQAMDVVRVAAAALATWLVVSTLLAMAGRVLRVRWLGGLAPAAVRRLVASALAGGLLVAPGVAAASTASGSTEPPPGVEAPVLQRVDEAEPGDVIDLRPPDVAIAPEARGGPAPEDDDDVHVVEPGDHLWGIAEMEVTARLGRPATDAEVVPYWRELIDASRTVVGPDPNLIRPGQRIDLPS